MSAKTEITDQEFVESIVKAIVDYPEEVVTGRTLDERGVLIQLTVNQEDMGKVIGREGRTAKAIRSLLRVFGARNESRINLKIVNPEGGEYHDNSDDQSESTKTATPEVKEKPPVSEVEIEPVKPIEPPVEEKATGVF